MGFKGLAIYKDGWHDVSGAWLLVMEYFYILEILLKCLSWFILIWKFYELVFHHQVVAFHI